MGFVDGTTNVATDMWGCILVVQDGCGSGDFVWPGIEGAGGLLCNCVNVCVWNNMFESCLMVYF